MQLGANCLCQAGEATWLTSASSLLHLQAYSCSTLPPKLRPSVAVLAGMHSAKKTAHVRHANQIYM